MPQGNGTLSAQQEAERFQVAASVLLDRLQAGARLGEMYAGDRNVYQTLGWKTHLSWQDYYDKYRRQDIAGRIVDLPADATWRERFELRDDDDPDNETPFEAAWKELEQRLRLISWMQRLDRIAGIGQYAVMYLGVRGQEPNQPLRKTRPGALMYVAVFQQPDAQIRNLVSDANNDRFGLPELYDLSTGQNKRTHGIVGSPTIVGSPAPVINAHWSRIIHAAESVEETRILGRPRLERVYNLLESLLLIVGATGEGYWRTGARGRYHLNIDPEFAGDLNMMVQNASGESVTLREFMGEELTKLIHGWQDFIRTSGSQVQQLSATMQDPRGAADVIIDLIAATTGWPKRILLGSERGELASSQDAKEFAHRIKERQEQYAEPTIVRPLIDRLIEYGMLPAPTGGEYEVDWPDLTGPNAEDRAKLAVEQGRAEVAHAQAVMLGHATITDNEFRATLGYPEIEQIEQEYPGEDLGLQDPPEPEPEPAEPEPETPEGEDDEGEDDALPAAAGAAGLYLNAITLGRLIAIVNAASDELFRDATADRITAAVFDLAVRTAARFGLAETDPATRATRDFMRDYGGSRVRDINDTTRDQLTRTLTQGMRADESTDLLARRVRALFREISAGRARTIATTECLPAETVVDAAVVRAGFRRWYDGEMVEIVTRDGRKFSATPNHPMLTRRGWVGAGDLTGEDDLVCDGRQKDGTSIARHIDVDDRPATIGEIFDALATIAIVEREASAPPDFHGDGRDGEIDVLCPDWVLGIGEFTPLFKPELQDILTAADDTTAPLCDSCGRLLSIDQRLCLCESPNLDSCLVEAPAHRGAVDAELLGNGGEQGIVVVSSKHGVDVEIFAEERRASSTLEKSTSCVRERASHAGGAQDFVYSPGRKTCDVGDLGAAKPILIKLDRVSTVRRFWFSGHVHNLDTPYGYFTIAGGLYTGNTNRAVNFGTFEGMVQAGVQFKQWFTVRDSKVRPEHVSLHGQIQPIATPFITADGATAQYPGDFGIAALDIGCRCYPVTPDPAAIQALLAGGPKSLVSPKPDPELVKRRAVHERRYLAGVRIALRAQALAALRELERTTPE